MSYEFREEICPYCQHRYMFHKLECGVTFCEYKDRITGKKLHLEYCPNCSKYLYAIENVLEGIKEDDDRIIEVGYK